MKFTTTLLAVTSLLTNTALADNCKYGWAYCGHDLISVGDYEQYIKDKLAEQGLNDPSKRMIDHSLWFCDGEGEASFQRLCPSVCNWGGQGQNDFCAPI